MKIEVPAGRRARDASRVVVVVVGVVGRGLDGRRAFVVVEREGVEVVTVVEKVAVAVALVAVLVVVVVVAVV